MKIIYIVFLCNNKSMLMSTLLFIGTCINTCMEYFGQIRKNGHYFLMDHYILDSQYHEIKTPLQ